MRDRIFALSPLTAIELTPPQLVDAASQAGFDATSLRLSPFRAGEHQHPMFGASSMLRETEARLRDTGLTVLGIEVLFLTPERDLNDFVKVFETAQRLGARNALTLIDIADASLAADTFAALCQLAAAHDIHCSLEFAAWLGVGSVQAATRVVRQAGQPNAGLLLDPFHLYRSGGETSDLVDLDPAWIRYAQFCDAPAVAPPTPAAISEEARYDRLLPGEGGLPLAAFLGAIPTGIPLELEVPNRTLAAKVAVVERLRATLRAAKEVATVS